MSLLPRLALLVGICCYAFSCYAQDGIFGGFGDPVPADPVGQSPEDADGADDNPLAPQLLEYSRRGHVQLAEAISSLARIGRWSDVNQLLTEVPARKLNQQALAEMSRRIGPAIFLRIKLNEEVTDPARLALDSIAAAAVAESEAPDRLRRAIGDLGSDSIDAKLSAARVLLGGGNVAVSELVAAAVTEPPPAPRDDLLRMMLQFGPGGIDALRQLALYGTPDVRARAIESLARINRQAHLAELVSSAYAADASEAERTIAHANLRKESGLPGFASALELLAIDFQNTQDRAKLVDNDDQTITLWSVNEDRTGVTFQTTSKIFAAYRDVVDAGSRLRRLGGLSSEQEGEVLAADMAYRLLIDPDWGDPDQVEAIRKAYGPAASASAVSKGISRALAQEEYAAAIGLIRLLEIESPTVLDQNLLLNGEGGSPTPLVQAASSSEPQVRYEAAMAVAKLAQGAPYAGSSRVMRTLSEMRSLTDKPLAILVETRPEMVIRLETILVSLGYRVDVVSTVSQLQRSVARGDDLRIIVAKTELADLPAIEMIDLVRRMDRGRTVPIVFHGTPVPGFESRRWRAPTVLIDGLASPAGLDSLMDAVRRRSRLPALTEIDRQGYRQAAENLLGNLAMAR